MATIEVSVSHFLAMGSPATTNIIGATASNSLALTHLAKTQFLTDSAKNFLHLGQTATLTFKIKNVSVAHYLDFHSKGARSAGVFHVLNNLAMWDRAKSVKHEIVKQTLTLTHIATFVLTKAATNTLFLTDQATVNMVRNRTATNTLALTSHGKGYIANKYSSSITLPILNGPNAPECQ